MKFPDVANSDARPLVLKCKEFNGANNDKSTNGYAVSGRKVGYLYAVYSYGYWPMFVCDMRTDTWFANADKYSSTTSTHSGQCHPHGKDCAPLPTEVLTVMLEMARNQPTAL